MSVTPSRMFARLGLALMFAYACCLMSAQTQPRDLRLKLTDTVTDLPASAKRWALVIGVDQYLDKQITPLIGSANDASALAAELVETAGFPKDQVILLATNQPVERQPTRTNIIVRLSRLKAALAAAQAHDGLLLVFFAGHGIERAGRAYLVPSDATISADLDVLEQTALSVDYLKQAIREIGVNQVILLLDACRSDPSASRGLEAPNPLTSAYQFNFDVRNREVSAFATVYATSVGQRAFEYAEKLHGYFTWALVEGLRGGAANPKGEVTLGHLVSYLQDRVPKLVAMDLGPGKDQRPFAEIQGYKADQLILAKVAPPTTAVNASEALEFADWVAIKDTSDLSAFEGFLKKYPTGLFVKQAQIGVQQLTWASIRNTTNPEAFRGYISRYPESSFAFEARSKLAQLDWDAVRGTNDVKVIRDYLGRYPNSAQASDAQARMEQLEWDAVRSNNDAAPAKEFLNRYPDSRLAFAARTRIEQLEWEAIKNSRSKEPLEAYLKKYPQGVYAEVAAGSIRKLETPVILPTPAAEPVAGPRPLQKRENQKDKQDYIYIAPGSFSMGCAVGDKCERAELPTHTVKLTRGFWIGKTEVTAGAYKRFAREKQVDMPPAPRLNKNWQFTDHPIGEVTWEAASAFCEWIGGRLPTEAEWEYAARGGVEGKKYPWGDEITHENANYYGVKGRDEWEEVAPVMSFDPNHFGLYDMSGNVWEWCLDWFEENYYKQFEHREAVDPRGPVTGKLHSARGGSFSGGTNHLTSSSRMAAEKGNKIGFRCIWEPQ